MRCHLNEEQAKGRIWRSATRSNVRQVLRLLDCVIFNALIGNHAAHAKNFSLLHSAKDAMAEQINTLIKQRCAVTSWRPTDPAAEK